MRRSGFIGKAAALAVSNTALQLLGFAYRIMLCCAAGPEGMGVYTLVMQVYTIVISVCISGLCVAVTTVSARLFAHDDLGGAKTLVRTAVCAYAVLFALLALPVALLRGFIAGSVLGDARAADALLLVLLCLFLTGFENIWKALFTGAKLVRYTAVSEVGEQLVRIAAVLALLYTLSDGDSAHISCLIIAGMCISEVYSVVFLGISYKKRFAGIKPSGAAGIARAFRAVALPASGTFVVSNLFASAATVVFPARLVAAGFTHAGAVAQLGVISGMAAPLFMLPAALVCALSSMLLPTVSGSREAGDIADMRRKIKKGLRAAVLIALPASAMLVPLVPPAAQLLFSQTISMRLSALLGINAAIGFCQIAAVNILNGLGEQRRVLVIALVTESAQLALVWLLTGIPSLNIYGYMAALIVTDAARLALNVRRIVISAGVRLNFGYHIGMPVLASAAMLLYSRWFYIRIAAAAGQTAGVLCSAALCCVLLILLIAATGSRVLSCLAGLMRRTR